MLGRICFLIACISGTFAIPFLRDCSNVKVVENFNLDKYMGTWYVYSGIPTVHPTEQKCQTEIYEKREENIVGMKSSYFYTKTNSVDIYQTPARHTAAAKFAMKLNQGDFPAQPNYFVLGTDYNNWAVVYNCMEFDTPAHTEMLWILTRERVPKTEYVHAAEEILKQHHFDTQNLYKFDQRSCSATF